MAKHIAPQLKWHASIRSHHLGRISHRHMALFTHYPRRVIDESIAHGLTPHIAHIQSFQPFQYVLWTTPPS